MANRIALAGSTDVNGANLKQVSDAADALAAETTGLAGVIARLLGFNGATYDRIRVANVFKPFASTAITAGTGATIWTPAAGKKFRLMGYAISTSVAGQIILGDNLVGTVIARTPILAAAGHHTIELLGNGILSGAADRVLKIDGPTGNVAGMVWGTEE